MTRTRKICIAAVLIVALLIVAWRLDWFSYLTTDNIRAFSASHPVLGPLAFILVYVSAIVFFLPIIPFAILAGALFGTMAGFAYVSTGAIIGAVIAFYTARYFGDGFVERVSRGKFHKVHEYDRKIAQNGFKTVLFVRLMPLLPFKGPNYLFGFTKVTQRDYLLGTIIGVLPESFVLALIGSTFTSLSPWKIMGALFAIGMLLTVGFLVQQGFKRVKRGKKRA